jgi:hypothetical protein
VARDLIPPPSPAGRPDRETAFSSASLQWDHQDEELADALEEPVLTASERSSFQSRFGLIIGALIGLGIAALAVLVIVIANDPGPEPKWSKWQPDTDDRNIAIILIGRYVSAGYRLDSGDQLNTVDAEPLELDGSALRVVVRTTGKGEGANIEEIDGRTVLFTLKGLGPRGSIDTGEPSAQRLALLRREATEIALYTFKYVKGVDNVVALLPPAPPTKAEQKDPDASSLTDVRNLPAMLFRPGDLEQALKTPLAATFPEDKIPRPSTITQADVDSFKLLAEQHAFNASITSDQLGTGVLVLDRPSASASLEETIRSLQKG